ncbi:MAG: HupE/UreJ family protein [Bacteroidota bacterium]
MSSIYTKKIIPLSSLMALICAISLPVDLLAHGVSATDQEVLTNGGLLAYILIGAKHMITGYDHILFLVGVVFFLKNFKDIIRFISIFTLGHSITLIAATFS